MNRKPSMLVNAAAGALIGAALFFTACPNPTGDEEPVPEPGSYTVTFTAGTGSGAPPAQQRVASGTVIALPEQGGMLAPDEKTFDGWKTGEQTYAAKAAFTVTADTQFVAQWRGPIDPNKTYIQFNNLEQFPVIMHSDPSRQMEVARVPAAGTTLIETDPKPQGTVFYPRFLLDFEDIPLSYDGTAVMIRVDEKKVNNANIPRLTFIETGSAFIKIENTSAYSLTFNQGSYELSPLGAASNIVMPGENAAYRIEPGAASQDRAMRNGSIPIAFPTQTALFEAEMLYSFSYVGSGLILNGVKPLTQALTMLPAPGPVSVSVASPSSVSLTWPAAENAASYKVYRSGALDGEYAFLETVSASPYTGENLSGGTGYFYKVQAVSDERESPLSAACAILILPTVQDLAAQVEESANITLSWTAAAGAGEYKVYRSGGPDEEYGLLETVSGLAYTDTSPSVGTQYSYTIQAVDTETAGASPLSAELAARILAAPQLSAQVASESAISLSWEAVEGADTYNVYRSNSPDTDFTLIETLSELTYIDQGLSVGSAYCYKLRGANSQGDGVFSATAPVKILPTPQAQAQASSAEMAITLSWGAVTGAASYQVCRSATADTGFAAIGTTNELSYTDANLSGGTIYYYTIQALHTAEFGTSPLSAPVSAPALAAPQLSAQVASESAVSLSWEAVEGASLYKVYRSNSPDMDFTLIETLSERAYTDQGLSVGSAYYYKLRGANAQGDGVFSIVVPVKILAAPQQVKAQASSAQAAITLSWGAVTGATSYQVYRSATAGMGFAAIGTASGLSYTDGNLSGGTAYYYTIQAMHPVESGASPLSAQVSATTIIPPGISNLTYSSVSGGTWTVQSDGSRKSPVIANGGMAKARISFTSGSANQSITIQLRVDSAFYSSSYYSYYSYAFISALDNASATYSSGYYNGSVISGVRSVSITIPVPYAGSHFIDIGYQKDNQTYYSGADCAWFTVTNY
jgi:fibronectin type 3 domain-containing protein